MEAVRAFIAINLSGELVANLEALQRRLADRFPSSRVVRWVRPEQIHLTLKFLGNVDATRIEALSGTLRKACAASAPFNLRAERLGCFPSFARPRVVWVGMDGDLAALRGLQKNLDEATREFSAHEETREWQPHLTIGRIGNARGAELREIGRELKAAEHETLGALEVRSVELMRSTPGPRGSAHTCLTSVKL